MGSVRGNRALPICVDDDFIGTRTKKKRTRRSPEERIKELQAKIVEIQTRAARKRDPTMTHINASVRAIDKALGTTEDSATRKALEEARTTLAACLQMNGVSNGAVRATTTRRREIQPRDVLAYLKSNPGSAAADVADALGTDTASLRPVIKELVEAKQVKRTGVARGTRYSVA